MALNITDPAFLFPGISLLFLAYTNRYLTLAGLVRSLNTLNDEHDALNREVDAIAENGVVDQLKFARLKKEKLRIKDLISEVEDQITPDIIA